MSSDCATENFIGKVKWFNNKSGFGFITILDSEHKDKDIFAHHSSLVVKNEIYKYLVQGEYVQFNLQKLDSGNHEYQAVNITGIKSNDLMCETRHTIKDFRPPTTVKSRSRVKNSQ